MTEIICALLGAAATFYFIRCSEKKEKAPEVFLEEKEGEEDSPSAMLLRNGYGVTKDKKPTFAEQWMNIINYCGESQLEEDYEEN